MALMQRSHTAGAFRPAQAPLASRPARRQQLRVRAEAPVEAKAGGVETSATYFPAVYDIEKIKTILPHR